MLTNAGYSSGAMPTGVPCKNYSLPGNLAARKNNYQRMTPLHAVTRITPPNRMRYQAKAAKECLLTKRIRNLTASSALTNETMQLTTSGVVSNCAMAARSFQSSYSVADTSTGIATKNENSAAVRRESPHSRPPMMVAPDRLVPGISDSAWKAPSLSASVAVI